MYSLCNKFVQHREILCSSDVCMEVKISSKPCKNSKERWHNQVTAGRKQSTCGLHVCFIYLYFDFSFNVGIWNHIKMGSVNSTSPGMCAWCLSPDEVCFSLWHICQCSLQSHFQTQLASPSLHSRNGMKQKDTWALLCSQPKSQRSPTL